MRLTSRMLSSPQAPAADMLGGSCSVHVYPGTYICALHLLLRHELRRQWSILPITPEITVEIAISDGVSITGGGLSSPYSATAFHFHWGTGTLGSEHRLTSRQYPMEMHVVHTKGGMKLSEAKQDPNGIAVLGFFIDVMDSANKSQLTVLSELLDKVSTPGTSLQLNSSLSLDDLLGDVNLTTYYRYKGSLTTPTCDEVVIWTVFKNPITVPSTVVKAFASAVKHNISGNFEILQNNFRPPQPLNGRRVQASFPISTALSLTSTAAYQETSAFSSSPARHSCFSMSVLTLLLLLTQ
ncbi:carbonic anhydrase 4-like [Rhinoderma darwinii]|uniref:carbonic anhydrase 4-like n=1 Tax=Rhinoderma darwinii TaxID=43563 RepID=UPI003F676A5D